MALHHRHDVIILGAGAAGLSALRELRRAGIDAICLEARDRIGGRILTVHDPLSPVPVELGPEFIHGRPREIWELIASLRLTAFDCDENAVHIRDGKPLKQSDSWNQIARITGDMKAAEQRGEEMTFAEFLAARDYPPLAKELATNFVEGFNAARKEEVSMTWLARDARAAEKIDGDQSFRLTNGYGRLAELLASGHQDAIYLNHIAEAVTWRRGEATVTAQSGLTGRETKWSAKALAVTVPLGVLQSEAIRFSPPPEEAMEAALGLRFGDVIRLIMRFRQAWWEREEHLRDAGFWLSAEPIFPTWWTQLPMRCPLLVGWSAGPRADSLLQADRNAIVDAALRDLAAVANVRREAIEEQLAAVHLHDWHNDPFARGAYSYVPVGALRHRETLAKPVENTLFFAGEATELEGHSATVHGAIATGVRCARQILESR